MSSLPEIPAGTVIAGKYRVERTLGAGGMGFVVAATHLELEQVVAVKFLHGAALGNPDAIQRFMREAQAAARIRSEHVARVLDVGRLEEGEPYMVLEYLQGEDLAQLLQRGPLPAEDAVDYLAQACHAIAEAHDAGIVHRNLKPSNLFLVRNPDGTGTVKVLDFGISKLTSAGETDPQLTKTATMMGSPLYMSPEQMKSARHVDARTDIWSLGTILYELLAGKPPFNGESLPELVTAVVISAPVPLEQERPELPAGLSAAVMRCLEKDPAQRYQNVPELARALTPFAPRRSELILDRVTRRSVPAEALGSTVPAGGPSAQPSAVAGTAAPWSHTSSAPKASKRTIWLVAAAVLLLGGGLVAARQLTHRETEAAVKEPAASVAPAAPPVATTATHVVPAPEPTPTIEPQAEPVPPPSSAPSAAAPAHQAVISKPRAPSALAVAQPPAPAKAPAAAAPKATAAPAPKPRTLDIPLK